MNPEAAIAVGFGVLMVISGAALVAFAAYCKGYDKALQDHQIEVDQ